MMRNLRWYGYVWSELTGPTTLGLVLWTFILLMNAFFLVAEKALSKGLGWRLALQLFGYEIPGLLVLSIPMAILLGALIAVGRLSADHEWVALQSAGHGPSRLLRPLLGWGLAGSLVAFGVYAVLVPRANYASRQLFGEVVLRSNLAADLRPGAFYTQLPGTVMFVDNIRAGEMGRLEGVLIHRSDPRGDGKDELIVARSGDLAPAPDRSGRLGMRLYDGVLYRYDETSPTEYQVFPFRDYDDELPAQDFLRGLRGDPARSIGDMSFLEVWRELGTARRDDALHPRVREIRVRMAAFELHRRIALPLACLVFAALALPLGITRARSGKGAGLAVSLLVIVLYWVVFTFSRSQFQGERMEPWLAAWSANLMVAPWAAIAYWRLRRSRGEREGLVTRLLGVLRRAARWLVPRRASVRAAESADGEADAPLEIVGNSSRFVGLLDHYVGRHYLRLFLLTLVSAIMIYSVVELRRLLDGALKNQQPLGRIAGYFLYAWPGMLNLAAPIACLVAGIVTFTALSRTGELTAVRAAGISARRALLPVVVLTGLICGLLFLAQDQVRIRWGGEQSLVVGWALTSSTNQKAEQLRDQIMGRAPITHGMPAGGQWAFGPRGERLYHYRLYDPENGVFQGLSVLTLNRSAPRVVDHRFSPLATWDGHAWQMRDGWHWSFPDDPAGGTFENIEGVSSLALDPPERFAQREAVLSSSGSANLQEQMSSAELLDQIRDLSASGYDTSRLEVALWGKLAQATTPLVMVLLGLPFAFRVGRRGSLYGIGVAILLVIVYWATFAVFNALGLETILPPLLAAWTPNVLYGLLGVYLILYIPT